MMIDTNIPVILDPQHAAGRTPHARCKLCFPTAEQMRTELAIAPRPTLATVAPWVIGSAGNNVRAAMILEVERGVRR